MIEFLRANWVNLAIVAGLLTLFLLLRNRTTRISRLGQVLGQGKPVIVEIFSNT